jgi:hypothetical protein
LETAYFFPLLSCSRNCRRYLLPRKETAFCGYELLHAMIWREINISIYTV